MESAGARWSRRVVEGLTITFGILLAFAIDAWWDRAQERRSDLTALASVQRELRTTGELLEDAIRLHGLTQVQGREVLEMTSSGRLTVPPDSLDKLVISLWRSYIINPPTGALEAAMLAGAIGRLENEDLKDRLLGWHGLLEDLLEEEIDGSRNATSFVREYLSSQLSLQELYSAYGESVSGEMVGDATPAFPPTRHEAAVESLLDDREFENQVLTVTLYAKASEDEARAFRETLDSVIERLERVLRRDA